MSTEKVSTEEKLSHIDDLWNQRIVGELNGQHLELVKTIDAFPFHKHDHEDKLIMVIIARF